MGVRAVTDAMLVLCCSFHGVYGVSMMSQWCPNVMKMYKVKED